MVESKVYVFRTLKPYATNPKGVTKFSTSGLDGVLAIWDLKVWVLWIVGFAKF